MCSSLLQLAPRSRDLSQAEKRITVMQSLADSKNGNYIFLLKMTTLFI